MSRCSRDQASTGTLEHVLTCFSASGTTFEYKKSQAGGVNMTLDTIWSQSDWQPDSLVCSWHALSLYSVTHAGSYTSYLGVALDTICPKQDLINMWTCSKIYRLPSRVSAPLESLLSFKSRAHAQNMASVSVSTAQQVISEVIVVKGRQSIPVGQARRLKSGPLLRNLKVKMFQVHRQLRAIRAQERKAVQEWCFSAPTTL